jgi:hypothetical protein
MGSLFGRLAVLLSFGLPLLLGGCPPSERLGGEQAEGTYLASANKLFDLDEPFDIHWTVVYPELDAPDLSLNKTDRELTWIRCTLCHECGFEEVFDLARHGTPDWAPRYVGDQWAPVVQRMRVKEGSFLNEVIAQRIYTYLRDDTLGVYDESKDLKGAVVVEVDAPEGNDEPGGAGGSVAPGPAP